METKQGHLKIFFGYCAGVGKTYSMLEQAHLNYVKGVDVVAGYIEPHDRKETKALAFGLEEIPVKRVVYKDHLFYEFDIDKALERHPDLILVDELAHTNVPGSRHQKRYQDIEELLRAGIDVYTTVNVQHLESLHDIVESITRVKVNERIPDRIFDLADDVQLVDIEIDQLLERLKEGKIYHKKQAERALTNFFIKDNLAALREIALRRCADRINLLQANHKPYTKEHILVCIGTSPTNQKVIRTASRMAQAFHADFTALYVETSSSSNLTDKALIQLNSNLALARHLNAQIVSTYGEDIAFQIGQYAKTSAVSKLVLGRSARKRTLFQKSTLVDQLTNINPNLEIYIIPDTASKNQKSRFDLKKFARFTLRETIISLALMTLATILAILFYELGSSITSIVLIYLLAVSLIGTFTYFPVYNFLATLISIFSMNFLFVEPRFTFSMYSKDYFVVFAVMFIVAFIINSATRNLKIESILASNHAHMMDVLLETSQQLQTANNYDDIREVTCFQLQKLLKRLIIFYKVENGKLQNEPMLYGDHVTQQKNQKFKDHNEVAVAQWVYTNNKNAGATTSTLPNAHALYLAIRKGSEIFAIVGIELEEHDNLQPFEKTLLKAILNEIALAFDSTIKESEKLAEQFKDEMEHED